MDLGDGVALTPLCHSTWARTVGRGGTGVIPPVLAWSSFFGPTTSTLVTLSYVNPSSARPIPGHSNAEEGNAQNSLWLLPTHT